MTGESLASLLVLHPFGDDDALFFDGTTVLTKAQAGDAARAIRDRLVAEGVGPGDAVAIDLPNDTSFIVAMFGVWLSGAVFVPLNVRAPETERVAAIDATRPAVRLTTAGVERLGDPRVYAPEVAFVLWTSGTTGRPKPILHTHGAYFELLDRVLAPLRGRADRRAGRPTPNLIPVSLASNAGIYNVLFGLRAGAAVVVMERFTVDGFAEAVLRHDIRATVLPPAAIAMLNDSDIGDLGPLRYVRSITAPLSPLQARRCAARFGVVVLNGYGQAEIGEVIGWTAADARDHPNKIGAAGRPHPGVSVVIGEPDDQGVGRLLVRPPAMAAGYAEGGELRDRVDADGFVDTGDLARVDGDGFVWIEGRAGELINRGGNKVFPDQVEEVLRLVPGVRDVAVAGVPDDRLGEVPVAFVVADAAVTDEALASMCRVHLVAYKIPVEFRRVRELPRSEVGKVLRRELVAMADHEQGSRT